MVASREVPTMTPTRRCILGVFAHLDDETSCAGGTLSRYAHAGGEVYVATAPLDAHRRAILGVPDEPDESEPLITGQDEPRPRDTQRGGRGCLGALVLGSARCSRRWKRPCGMSGTMVLWRPPYAGAK